jgi:hypothetical protein
VQSWRQERSRSSSDTAADDRLLDRATNDGTRTEKARGAYSQLALTSPLDRTSTLIAAFASFVQP